MQESESLNIQITPHFHYDYLWCAPPDHLGVKTARIIHDGLRLLRKYPSYKFIIDGVMALEYFRLHYSNEWGELKKAVHDHRIEIVGGHIIAPDTLIPCGESLVRQYLYGMRFLQKEFGQMSTEGYFVDSFGQTPQLPQILQKCGIKNLICMRGIGGRKIPSEFLWEAPDGSKVLTHFLFGSYSYILLPFIGSVLCPYFPFFPIPLSFNWIPQTFRIYELITTLCPPLKPLLHWIASWPVGSILDGTSMGGIRFTAKWRARRATSENIFVLLGSDNSPLTPEICDLIPRFNRTSLLNPHKYQLEIGFPSDFFSKLRKTNQKFKIIRNTEFTFAPDLHSGTFACRPRLKIKLRTVEQLIYLVEWIGSIANLTSKWIFPKERVKQAIMRNLCAGFHDGICGCHTDDTDKVMMDQLHLSELQLNRVLNEAICTYSSMISSYIFDTIKSDEFLPFLILNPVGWRRNGVFGLDIPKIPLGWLVKDISNNYLPIQENKIGNPQAPYVISIPDLPSSGSKIVFCQCFLAENEKISLESNLHNPFKIKLISNSIEISTSTYRALFLNGLFVELTTNKITIHGRDMGIGGILTQEDIGDSYYLGRDLPKNAWNKNSAEIIESGPVRVVVRLHGVIKSPKNQDIQEIQQNIIFYPDISSPIEFHTQLNNHFRNIRVQSVYPVPNWDPHFDNSIDTVVRSEIPYGFYVRKTLEPGMPSYATLKPFFSHFDKIKPIIHWMDFSHKLNNSDSNWGMTIINQACPEHEIGDKNSCCMVTLFRSIGQLASLTPNAVPRIASAPHQIPDSYSFGELSFHTALFLHNGNFIENAVKINQAAYNFITPIITSQIEKIQHQIVLNLDNSNFFKSILEKDLFRIEAGSVVVRVIKLPEDNIEGLILRVLEVSGESSLLKITFNHKIERIMLLNLLEEPITEMNVINQYSFESEIRAQEILTFNIRLSSPIMVENNIIGN